MSATEAYRFDKGVVEKAYAGWAPFYDVVFGAVLSPGRTAAVRAAERVGGRILEVGVGTGISLGQYSTRNRIVGIDLSEPMLRRAKARVFKRNHANVETLAVMDAERLGFADESFDVVVAQFVITAVPDPELALDEFARVVKREGEIVLVNHLGADTGWRRICEKGLAPVVRHLGWRPEFPFARIATWAQRAGFRLIERRATNPIGQLMRFRKSV
jgi:phosphatidylethanolamine/phosphatidyl-N-methylethanolamine N-methyltransferase